MFVARMRPAPGTAPDGLSRSSPPSSSPGGRHDAWLAPLFFLGCALLLRAPAFLSVGLDPDEGLYVVQAAAWLRGGWPYLAVWDMHPPGAPALIALFHALITDPVIALRVTGIVAVAATATGLHAVARLLGAGRATALAAGLFYIAHTLVNGGLATNTEILFAPFVTLAAWLLLREGLEEGLATSAPRLLPVLAAGLSAGIALWVKQVTALETSALWLTMVGLALAGGRLPAGRLFGLAGVFALGAGAPTLGMAAGYWMTGNLDAWAQGNIFAPLAYAGMADLAPGLRRGVLDSVPPLSVLLLACAGLWFPDAAARRAALLLLPWLAAALLAVVAPWKFYDHYFLILLPPLSLLGAFGLSALVRHVVQPALVRRGFAVLVALVVLTPAAAMMLPRLSHGVGLRAGDPIRAIAREAALALGPGDTMFVANWHTLPYALARQAPPTRYAFPVHLSGYEPGLIGVDADAELARVLALPPGAIIVAVDRWRLTRPAARAAIEAALAERYVLQATINDGTGPVQVWRRR